MINLHKIRIEMAFKKRIKYGFEHEHDTFNIILTQQLAQLWELERCVLLER